MKYFLDTEFSERGPAYPIQLISIGIVAEDGREFYAVHSGFDAEKCNEWVKTNVLPKLGVLEVDRLPSFHIAQRIMGFVSGDIMPEFWGYYADYDWVVFCQLFGTMVDLPPNFPQFCRDVKQWCCDLGNPQLPVQEYDKAHNALEDAHWTKRAYEFLEEYRVRRALEAMHK